MRKVTDLLPSEAILISSDADLKVLEEFEKAGIKWADGKLATKFNPLEFTQRTSICVFYDSGSLWFSVPNNYEFTVPATDFIPTDTERGLTIIKGDGSIITAQNQDGRVFDIEPIPTEAEKVEVLSKAMITIGMNLDANTALRIAKVLAKYEPEIWKEIKQEIRQVKIKTRNPETK